jgi:hypothetical protein
VNFLAGFWSEVILVDEQATDVQIQALLASLERQLHSFPAEIGPQRVWRNAVYRVPVQYCKLSSGPSLSLSFLPTEDRLVRKGGTPEVFHAWEYQGPLALREVFDLLH